MKEALLRLLESHPQWAFAISIAVNVIVALLGFVPSFFVTAANLLFFGFWKGTLISFLGEAIGAWLAFLLYRKGFKQSLHKKLEAYPRAMALVEAKGSRAFLLVVALRLLPFVPSGVVTLAASVGTMSSFSFLLASSLGKAPALLFEAWSVYQVTHFTWQGQLILAAVALGVLYWLWKKTSA